MTLSIDLHMDYLIEPDDPALLAITVARTPGQHVTHSTLEIEGAALRWIDADSPLGARVWATAPGSRLHLRYRAHVEITRADPDLHGLVAQPWHALPPDVLGYLRPSRYCPSDALVPFVRRGFGHLRGGAAIAAIRDWVADALAYVPGSSTAATTALDTFVAREGVCRDFAHLVCGMARAAGIPARYVTGYGPDVAPQDFHAVAEVWLDGAWHVVDATGMSDASTLAIIGRGRDAAEVAFMETERWATPVFQRIEVTRA